MDNIGVFLEQFLLISHVKTILFVVLLFVSFFIVRMIAKKGISFEVCMFSAMFLGIVLGFAIQATGAFPEAPDSVGFIHETTAWYGLFGGGFMSLIRMLVIPLVMVSIIHVIIHMEQNTNLGKLVRTTLFITMLMVVIAAVVGVVFGILFTVGKGMQLDQGTTEIKEVKSIVETLRNLIPANPIRAMVEENVIGLVIFSAIIAAAARAIAKTNTTVMEPFYKLIDALHQIVIKIASEIISYMPFAIIPLLANTIALRGVKSILGVGVFIIALYVALFVMFVIQLIAIALFGYNPAIYLKKSMSVMILAFTSRSSVGALPVTIDTLTDKLGVNRATASFVASFGTTAGMQGCAGVFPAMLIVFVTNMIGQELNLTLIVMTIIVVAIGSLGIAGIPGTATMAASVSLSGTGLGAYYPLISPIFAIDPIIDMGRTLVNVTGSLTNALMVDKLLGQVDMEHYKAGNPLKE